MWVQVVRYNLFSVVFFVLGCSLLILSLPLLKLGSKSTCLCSGFCVRRPRQYNVISWEFDIFWGFFCFFLVHCLGRWSQWMCLLCNRMRGILTQGPAPDPKCKLNISSFLTLPHPLHCLICAKNIMIIVLLLQMMGEIGRLGGGSFMFGWGNNGSVSYF